MAKDRNSRDLLVFEYGGEARSGKGTIVDHLVTRDGVAKEETGIDYRFLTKKLLDENLISPAMSSSDIAANLAGLPPDKLVDILAQREGQISGPSRRELYEDDINQLVPDVGRVPNARAAVKAGFAKRIEVIRDCGQFSAVAIDGRNLAKVIDQIPGVRMVLRTFVICSPYEATIRECARENVDIDSAEGQKILRSIEVRNEKDRTRQEDPMVVDKDAIDYWQNTEIETAAKQLSMAQSTKDYWELAKTIKLKSSKTSLPQGAGRLAASTGRQVKFDTTVFRLFESPKETMLEAAERMFDEALSSL